MSHYSDARKLAIIAKPCCHRFTLMFSVLFFVVDWRNPIDNISWVSIAWETSVPPFFVSNLHMHRSLRVDSSTKTVPFKWMVLEGGSTSTWKEFLKYLKHRQIRITINSFQKKRQLTKFKKSNSKNSSQEWLVMSVINFCRMSVTYRYGFQWLPNPTSIRSRAKADNNVFAKLSKAMQQQFFI